MALTYEVKINNRRLQATIGVAIHEKLEEALDEAAFHLPITVKGYSEKMLGLLQIIASDGAQEKSFDLLIISDKVGLQSKDGFYSHDLMAIEYTHKLDKMFISALTFTKPFVRKTRAPFQYADEELTTVTGAPATRTEFTANQLFPKIEFQENYFVGQEIKINQVGQALTDYNSGTLNDVYVRVNFPNVNFIPQNLTSSDLTYTAPDEPGDFIFEIGYYKGAGFQIIYKHYIRIIKEIRYTLYDMVERVRSALPIERESFYDNTRIFSLDTNLVSLFQSIEMPQMFFSHLSARQVLNTIFKYINAISRLKYVDDIEDELTVDFFNKITSSFEVNEAVDISILKDAQNYGTKAIGFLSNALQSNFRENASVQSPANNKYKTVRSNNIQLTRDSFTLKLEKPVYEINKIVAVIPKIDITYQSSNATYKETIEDFELDITSRSLEKSFWDLKLATNDIIDYNEENPFQENVGMRLNKNGNIYWQKNSKTIDFNLAIQGIFSATLLEETIQEAVNEEVTINPNFFFKSINSSNIDLPIYGMGAGLRNSAGLAGIGAQELANVLYRNIRFNIEYVTIDDTVVLIDKQDITENDYEAYLKINNLSSISDFSRTSRDMFGKIERSSMPVKTISKIHTNLSSLYDIGQIDSQGYIITERKIIFHSEFIEAVYTMTKDHNRLNEFNGINQEYRAFEVPSFEKTVIRKDFYSDYIFIQNPQDETRRAIDQNNLTMFDFNKYANFPFGHLNSSSYEGFKQKISYAFVRTDGFLRNNTDSQNDYKAIMTPVVSFGGKGNLSFTFDFDNNIVAGDSLTSATISGFLGIGTVQNIYNQPIAYTDEFGFFDKLWFGMGSVYKETKIPEEIVNPLETTFNQEYQYPLIKSEEQDLGQDFIIKNGEPLNPDWFNIYKDASTTYGFSYNLSIMPRDFQEYIIGQNFYTENPMVNSHREFITKKLYIHTDGTKYRKFEDLKVKDYTQLLSVELNQNNFKFNESSFTFEFDGNAETLLNNATSWAIGDEEGNLYIACNENYNGFSIFARHMRDELIQIGKQLLNRIYSLFASIESNIQVDINALLQRFGSIEDDVDSDVSLFVLTQPAARKQISAAIYGNAYALVLKQLNFKDNLNEEIRMSLVYETQLQENFDFSFNEPLKSNIVINAFKQNKETSNLNQPIKSNIIFGAFKQNKETSNLNQPIKSNIVVSAFKEETIESNLSEEIISFLTYIVFNEIKQKSSFVSPLNSNITVNALKQDLEKANTIQKINSNITVNALKQDLEKANTIQKINSNITVNAAIAETKEASLNQSIFSSVVADGQKSVVIRAASDVLNLTDTLDVASVINFDYNISQVNTNITLDEGLDIIGYNGAGNTLRVTVPSEIIQNNEIFSFNRYSTIYGTSPYEYYSTNPITTFATDTDLKITAGYDKIPAVVVSAKFTNLTNSNSFSDTINLVSRDASNNVVNSNNSVSVSTGSFQNVYYHYTGTGYSLRIEVPVNIQSGTAFYDYEQTIVRDSSNNIITTQAAYAFSVTNITTPISIESKYSIKYQLTMRAFASSVFSVGVNAASTNYTLPSDGTIIAANNLFVYNYPVTIFAPAAVIGTYTEGFDRFIINGNTVNGTYTTERGIAEYKTTVLMTQNVFITCVYNE